MDVRVNDMHSRIQPIDAQSLLEPRMREIVRMCVRAVKEELAREKRTADNNKLTNSIESRER